MYHGQGKYEIIQNSPGICHGKKSLGGEKRHRCNNNIKMDLREVDELPWQGTIKTNVQFRGIS
jgi:hypothetical protein